MKNRKIMIILAGLAVLSAAFLMFNFRAAFNDTKAQSNWVSASSGDGLPEVMQQRAKVTLLVTGEGPLVAILERSLTAEIRKAGLGEVELVDTLDTQYPNPVLRVDVGRPGVFWTPFFGSSQFAVTAGFVSNGLPATIGAKPVVFDSTDGPAVNMSAEYQVSDRSWGILSRPGYYQVLADSIARGIVEALSKLYQPKL